MITYGSHHKRERDIPHGYRDGPSAPGENYCLLIRRVNNGDEDGGGVDGDGSGGNSPLRQGARTETSVPQILLRRWRPRWNFSWMYRDSPVTFRSKGNL